MFKKTSEVVQAAGLAPLIVSIFTKLAVLVPPWLMLGFLYGLGALSHHLWGKPPIVSWAAVAGTLATTVLTALTWLVSHARGPIGRIHSTLSTLCAGMWFTVVTITGVYAVGTNFFMFFGGLTCALGWNIRAVIRVGAHGEDSSQRGGDALKQLFDRSKENFGLKGATVKTKTVSDHKIEAVMELPAGQKTAGDVIKKSEYMESGMHLPPGTVQITADEDDASKVHASFTDPRVLKRPIPWPGPSAPGGSIALPLRLGVYQDSETVLHPILGHHTQVMGATGSGKSIGGCWNYLGEIISRKDVAVFAIDTSKGEQTLGPLKPGLNRLEITKGGALAFLQALIKEIPKRTQWLTEHGYTKWVEGCGLLYWVVWIEESAKFWGNLSGKDEDLMLEVMKEIRSAGGTVVNSLQRSTHTEMPTLARSQHKGFMCFSVREEDAEYGLSDDQQDAEARPHQLKAAGMAVLDFPGQDSRHVPMPLRTWDWALGIPENASEAVRDKAAVATMTAYSARYPAQTKPMDEFTTRLTHFPAPISQPIPQPEPTPSSADQAQPQSRDAADLTELLAVAAEQVIASQRASTATLQRHLRVGYEMAQQILSALEMKGVVGPKIGDADREVRVAVDDLEGIVEALREDGHPIAEYLETEDPDPEVVAGPYDEIRTPTLLEDQFHTRTAEQEKEQRARKLLPEQARAIVHAWIRSRGLGAVFTATCEDLTRIRQETGNTSRQWMNKVLNELVDAGVLDKDTSGPAHRFTVADLAPLGREMADA